MDNYSTSTSWQTDTLSTVKNFSTWLSATPLLLVVVYLYYTRTKHVHPAYLTKLPAKKSPMGKIHQLCIHPIKSCAGISLEEVKFGPEGLENDRIFLIVSAHNHRFITARKAPKMVLIKTAIVADPSAPNLSFLEVSFPPESGCPTFRVPLAPSTATLKQWKLLSQVPIWHHTTDAYIAQSIHLIRKKSWLTKPILGPITMTFHSESDANSASSVLSKFFGFPVYLLFKGPSRRMVDATPSHPHLPKTTSAKFQDGYPFLVASVESLVAVEDVIHELANDETNKLGDEWKSRALEMERFRPNIVFRDSGKPFVEDDHQNLALGKYQFSLVSRCARCMLPNIDPSTGVMDKVTPSTALAKTRKGLDAKQKEAVFFGCNAITMGSGVLRVGNQVYALD